jgi:polar amino acid transport system permease protein
LHLQRPTPTAPAALLFTTHGSPAALLLASVAVAQARPSVGVVELLIKWTPLLAKGFGFNLLISALAMALGTAAGLLLGFARISLLAPVRGTSWIVVQFFRNSPWLVLLFFVMFLMPFELHFGGVTVPFPDWIKATLGLVLSIMANFAEIVRGAVCNRSPRRSGCRAPSRFPGQILADHPSQCAADAPRG